ncbi:MAG: 1-deoxy-D-xylulose-5-phosphate reductoisomerase [Desulfovibrionaceae bacterium]
MKYISQMPSNTWSTTFPRVLSILGSTGSIGRTALHIVRNAREDFILHALSCGNNITLLAEQANEFRPPYLCILEENALPQIKSLLAKGYTPEIYFGNEGYAYIASHPKVDIVLSAQVGASGLYGTHAAIAAGKVVALANKESLVLAGELFRALCKKTGAVILPVDSEHNALFQIIMGTPSKIRRILLTASGGPFRGKSREFLENVTPEMALKHPTWNMGAKISIDSATLMNKAFEIIEAYHLFGLDVQYIDAIIHPESIIHSLVEFKDNSQIAQLSIPDMKLAIGHAIYYPRTEDLGITTLDLTAIRTLTFDKMPTHSLCFSFAHKVLEKKGFLPIILNGANEIAVELFLKKEIGFLDIPLLIEKTLEYPFYIKEAENIEDILQIDILSRKKAYEIAQSLRSFL